MKIYTFLASLALVATSALAASSTSGSSTSGSSTSGSSTSESSTTASSTTASSTTTSSTTTGSGSYATSEFMTSLKKSPSGSTATKDSYHMKPVHVVHARVQSDAPVWNDEGSVFVSMYGDGLADGHLQAMDSVNTASVEGALMYVQAEGINYNTRSEEEKCTRKNDMQWIVFYELAIRQTNETIALYDGHWDQPEYGTYVAMDSGRCTPTSGGSTSADTEFPKVCYYYNGDKGEPDIGPFVGGQNEKEDPRAPYPNNIWFSFPNTCPLVEWSVKDEDTSCRNKTRQGLCDLGVMPDGEKCTFNYRILGYLPIDDLVGITSMDDNETGETYANFSQFCESGGVEFKASDSGEWQEGISFWDNPQDEDANVARYEAMVAWYQALVNGDNSTNLIDADTLKHFVEIPSIEDLQNDNYPCYYNVEECASAKYGCVREHYSQICTVCNTTSDGCQVAPSDWSFPELEEAVGSNGETGDASATASDAESGSAGTQDGSGTSTLTMSVAGAFIGLSLLLN